MLTAIHRYKTEVNLDGSQSNADYEYYMDFDDCHGLFTAQDVKHEEGFKYLTRNGLRLNDLQGITFEPLVNLESYYHLYTFSVGFSSFSSEIIIIKKQYGLDGTGEPHTTCYPVPDNRNAKEEIFFRNDDFEISFFDAVKCSRLHGLSLEEYLQLETIELQHLFDYYLVIGY